MGALRRVILHNPSRPKSALAMSDRGPRMGARRNVVAAAISQPARENCSFFPRGLTARVTCAS